MRLPQRLLLVLTIPIPLLLAACGGGGEAASATADADASELRSESLVIAGVSVEEKRGSFGPGLGFVLRLPQEWDGRLLVAIPGAAGTADDLDAFALPQVLAGTAYASIDSSDALSAPTLYEDFLGFVTQQTRLAYGRDPDQRYLMGVSQGAWQVQQLLEGDHPAVDGALLVAPWSPDDALRSYPALLAEVEKLRPRFDGLATGSLVRLDAAELLIVEGLIARGLPAGSYAAWPGIVGFWQAALAAAQGLIDPGYPPGASVLSYDLAGRPSEVLKRVEQLTPAGELAVPTVLLQGGLDVVAVPGWSRDYEARVLEAERDRGLRVFAFPDLDHRLRGPGETSAFADVRLRRGWETITGWVEAGVEPITILGVEPTVATTRQQAAER